MTTITITLGNSTLLFLCIFILISFCWIYFVLWARGLKNESVEPFGSIHTGLEVLIYFLSLCSITFVWLIMFIADKIIWSKYAKYIEKRLLLNLITMIGLIIVLVYFIYIFIGIS